MTVKIKWKNERVIGKWNPPAKTFLFTSTSATEDATLPSAKPVADMMPNGLAGNVAEGL